MRARAGFALVEVLITLGILGFVTMSIATGVGAGHRATAAIEREALLHARGQEYLERLLAIPFGRPADGAATGAQLSEVFDDDGDFGSVTLHRLRLFGPALFEPASFPVAGRFTVAVDGDLDGDGVVAGPDEGRNDLLRISVMHEGRLLARTVRFDPIG